MKPIISVLICSVPSRIDKFNIIQEVSAQAKDKLVEVIYLGDNWGWSIGEKRNKLISLASGRYCVFIDDDDRISSDYLAQLLHAVKGWPDVITFKAEIKFIDNDRYNCRSDNLIWNNHYNSNRIIECINTNEIFYSQRDIVNKFDINQSN